MIKNIDRTVEEKIFYLVQSLLYIPFVLNQAERKRIGQKLIKEVGKEITDNIDLIKEAKVYIARNGAMLYKTYGYQIAHKIVLEFLHKHYNKRQYDELHENATYISRYSCDGFNMFITYCIYFMLYDIYISQDVTQKEKTAIEKIVYYFDSMYWSFLKDFELIRWGIYPLEKGATKRFIEMKTTFKPLCQLDAKLGKIITIK